MPSHSSISTTTTTIKPEYGVRITGGRPPLSRDHEKMLYRQDSGASVKSSPVGGLLEKLDEGGESAEESMERIFMGSQRERNERSRSKTRARSPREYRDTKDLRDARGKDMRMGRGILRTTEVSVTR
jgi:hypothetical protein